MFFLAIGENPGKLITLWNVPSKASALEELMKISVALGQQEHYVIAVTQLEGFGGRGSQENQSIIVFHVHNILRTL
jgi:hypothetical protein